MVRGKSQGSSEAARRLPRCPSRDLKQRTVAGKGELGDKESETGEQEFSGEDTPGIGPGISKLFNTVTLFNV